MRSFPILSVVASALALTLPASALAATSLAPASKQVLRVGIGSLPSSLDPGKADYESDLIVQDALFPSLYRSTGGANGRLTPYLAAGQPVVANGGRRYTVTIRATRWSDGRAVTAADVVTGFTRAKRTSYYGSFFTNVRSVRAIGARTVRFELARPVPWFGELLASNVTAPVPSHVIRAKGAKWTLVNNIVTAGPFRVLSGRGRTELVLARNRYWWGARSVRLREVQLLAVDAASVSPLFRGGRLDVTLRGGSIHPTAYAQWQADPRFKDVPSGDAQFAYLNTRAAALQSPAVRRGLALALDRAGIASSVGYGGDPLNAMVPPHVRGASTVTSGSRLLGFGGVFDSTRAAAELAAGGWVAGTKLNLFYSSDTTTPGKVAAAIEAQLAPYGVDVVLLPTRGVDLAKVGIGYSPTRDDVHVVLQGWVADYSDPQNFHQLFTCAAIDAGLNPSNLCSPEFDAAYAAALAATGFARLDAHRAAEDLLSGPTGLMPAIPLYVPGGHNLVQPWVRGHLQHPSGRVYFEKIAILDR